jgi:hypothetical protein
LGEFPQVDFTRLIGGIDIALVTRMRIIIALAAFVLACGSSDVGPADDASPESSPDAGAADDVAIDAAPPLPDMPQVTSLGGAVVTAPNVVPVFWANDPDQAKLESFLGALAGSTYWTQATSEYGVGALTVAPSVVVTDPAPSTIDDSELGPWLQSKIGIDPSWPAANPNNVYVLYHPSTTTITSFGGKSCVNFRGYHSHLDATLYVVKPRCAGTSGGFDAFDWMTKGTSHELAEVATDPLWDTSPAYDAVDDDHAMWGATLGTEIGDMCDPQPQSIQRLVASYAVERIWSNASARAGHDPCVPALVGAPYFNVAPIFSAKVPAPNPQGLGAINTLGVKVPVGQTITVPVQFFADGPMADWTVSAQGEHLTTSWDSSTGNNGDVHQLSITRTAPSTGGGSVLMLVSTSGALQNFWFAFVTN